MRKCLNCQESFIPDSSVLRREKIGTLRGNEGKFCSMSCANKYNNSLIPKKVPNVKCAYCSKSFYKPLNKLKNSKSGLFFCCRTHKDLAQRIGGIKEIMPSHYGTGNSTNTYRAKAFRMLKAECSKCNYKQHPEILVVHHINNDRNINSIENLQILCPNCHALVHRQAQNNHTPDDN